METTELTKKFEELVKANKVLASANKDASVEQNKVDNIRAELVEMYLKTLPDDIKVGSYILTSEGEMRIDHIEVNIGLHELLSSIKAYGYGITHNLDNAQFSNISNNVERVVKDGSVTRPYELLTKEQFEHRIEVWHNRMKKPIENWTESINK